MHFNLKVSTGRKQQWTLLLYAMSSELLVMQIPYSLRYIPPGDVWRVRLQRVFRNDHVNGKIFENEMYLTWDVNFECLYNS
jgi:hypothetical protein